MHEQIFKNDRYSLAVYLVHIDTVEIHDPIISIYIFISASISHRPERVKWFRRSRRNHLTRSGRWLMRVMSRQLLLHVVCIYYIFSITFMKRAWHQINYHQWKKPQWVGRWKLPKQNRRISGLHSLIGHKWLMTSYTIKSGRMLGLYLLIHHDKWLINRIYSYHIDGSWYASCSDHHDYFNYINRIICSHYNDVTCRQVTSQYMRHCRRDDVIKWKHFPCYWPFVWGIHRSRSPVNSPHKDQWRGALMCSLTWINGWVNNGEAGDLRRHRAHCDVTVMPGSMSPYGVTRVWFHFLC